MAKSINRYFQMLATTKPAKPSGRLWYPAADVYQTPDGWLVKVELAGVSAEELQIEVYGNVLYISGCRRDGSCSGNVSYHQMEITYSHFEKTLQFPAPIEGAKIEHSYQDGILYIYLKKEEAE